VAARFFLGSELIPGGAWRCGSRCGSGWGCWTGNPGPEFRERIELTLGGGREFLFSSLYPVRETFRLRTHTSTCGGRELAWEARPDEAEGAGISRRSGGKDRREPGRGILLIPFTACWPRGRGQRGIGGRGGEKSPFTGAALAAGCRYAPSRRFESNAWKKGTKKEVISLNPGHPPGNMFRPRFAKKEEDIFDPGHPFRLLPQGPVNKTLGKGCQKRWLPVPNGGNSLR